jgi:hypothetical protein
LQRTKVGTLREANIPQETGDEKQNLNPLEDIVGLEPADKLLHIGPDLPAHTKGDDKAKQLETGSALGRMVAVDGDDSDCPS